MSAWSLRQPQVEERGLIEVSLSADLERKTIGMVEVLLSDDLELLKYK
jgi:hypothetical protein